MKSIWDVLDSIDEHDLNGYAIDIINEIKERIYHIDDNVREAKNLLLQFNGGSEINDSITILDEVSRKLY